MLENWTYAEVYAVCAFEVGMRILTDYYRTRPNAFQECLVWECDNLNLNSWRRMYETDGYKIWGNCGGPYLSTK